MKCKMQCEHPLCSSNIGKDYNRLPSEQVKGWEDEPIFLCDEHSNKRIEFIN